MPQIARQRWSAERCAETAHFVPALGSPVIEMLAPSAGEPILDLGCGDGVLTEKILAAGAMVVAVDAAAGMVAAARSRGIDARVMDGQQLTFAGEFDAVFSNAALHWMRDQEAVLAGGRRVCRPGSRRGSTPSPKIFSARSRSETAPRRAPKSPSCCARC